MDDQVVDESMVYSLQTEEGLCNFLGLLSVKAYQCNMKCWNFKEPLSGLGYGLPQVIYRNREVRLKDLLSYGSSAHVFHGKLEGGESVVVKCFKDETPKENIDLEIRVLKLLAEKKIPQVPQLIGMFIFFNWIDKRTLRWTYIFTFKSCWNSVCFLFTRSCSSNCEE